MGWASLALASHSPHELFDLAARVDQTLLASEVWMALRADVEAKLFLGGVRRPGIAARAAHGSLDVLGMNIGTHVSKSNYERQAYSPPPKLGPRSLLLRARDRRVHADLLPVARRLLKFYVSVDQGEQ